LVSGVGLIAALSVPAEAQVMSAPAVPERGMWAAGALLGVAAPGDDRLAAGPALSVFGERYLSQRVSVRGMVGAAWWDISGAGDHNSVSPVSAQANVSYNWERGKWHPYGTLGLGLYKFRFTEDDIDSSTTAVGFNIGGGVEYFLRPRDTLMAELLIHPLVGDAGSRFTAYTPWYWAVSAGYKKYF
jgi:hypothetical protein